MSAQAARRQTGTTLRPGSLWWGLFRPRGLAAPSAPTLFLAVRSISAGSGFHELEYALVGSAGDVRLSAIARTASPVGDGPYEPGVWPGSVEGHDVDMRLARLCFGARLVAFHRVLQGGLLPPGVLDGVVGVTCAWRRFGKVARRRGLGLSRGESLDLADCLAHAELAPPASADAADRAQALRALWLWMDANE